MQNEPLNLPPIDPNTLIETARLRIVPVAERWIPEIYAEFRGDIVRWMSAPAAHTSSLLQSVAERRKLSV